VDGEPSTSNPQLFKHKLINPQARLNLNDTTITKTHNQQHVNLEGEGIKNYGEPVKGLLYYRVIPIKYVFW